MVETLQRLLGSTSVNAFIKFFYKNVINVFSFFRKQFFICDKKLAGVIKLNLESLQNYKVLLLYFQKVLKKSLKIKLERMTNFFVYKCSSTVHKNAHK